MANKEIRELIKKCYEIDQFGYDVRTENGFIAEHSFGGNLYLYQGLYNVKNDILAFVNDNAMYVKPVEMNDFLILRSAGFTMDGCLHVPFSDGRTPNTIGEEWNKVFGGVNKSFWKKRGGRKERLETIKANEELRAAQVAASEAEATFLDDI